MEKKLDLSSIVQDVYMNAGLCNFQSKGPLNGLGKGFTLHGPLLYMLTSKEHTTRSCVYPVFV